MASTTLTVPDDKVNMILDAFDAEFPGRIDAGMTKVQWYKFQLGEYTKQVTRNNLGNIAAGTARKSSDDTINSINIT